MNAAGRFRNRQEAGRYLAGLLESYRPLNPLVLALPRGGVPIAFEIAEALHCELDLLVVRKLGVPAQPELAFGAIASGGSIHINKDIVQLAQLSKSDIEAVVSRETAELKRREHAYRGDRSPVNAKNRVVILVDDGLATGASMEAAIMALRELEPQKVVVAVPVAAPSAARRISHLADDFTCVSKPPGFRAVGEWYEQFNQVSDTEVTRMLAAHEVPIEAGAEPS